MAIVGDFSLPVSLPEGQAYQAEAVGAGQLEDYIPSYQVGELPDLPAIEQPDMAPQETGLWDEFWNGVNRGADQMQALGAGGVALVADLIGMDTLRDWGYDEYLAQMEEAAQYAPTVGGFSEISDPATFLAWLAGTAGELAPQVIGAIASGGVGAAAGKGAIKLAIKRATNKLMQRGVSKEVAAMQALNQVGRSMLQKAAVAAPGAAVFGQTALQEAGGMYTGDVEQFGLGQVPMERQLQALGLGAAAGGLEMLGIESAILKSPMLKVLTKKKVIPKTTQARLAKRLAKHTTVQGFTEGTTEALQETLAIFHESGYRDVTMDDLQRVIDSFAAGAAGGVLFGGGQAMMQHMTTKPATEALQSAENEEATGDPTKTVDDAIAEEETKRDDAVKAIRTGANEQTQELDTQIDNFNRAVERGEMDPVQAAAEMTQVQDQKKTVQANLKRDAQRNLAEADKRLVELQQQKMGLAKDPSRVNWERDLATRLDNFAQQVQQPLLENVTMRPNMPQAEQMRTSKALAELHEGVTKLAKQIKNTPAGEQWRAESAVFDFINNFVPNQNWLELDQAVQREQQALREAPVRAEEQYQRRLREQRRAEQRQQRAAQQEQQERRRRVGELRSDIQDQTRAMRERGEQEFRAAAQMQQPTPEFGPRGTVRDLQAQPAVIAPEEIVLETDVPTVTVPKPTTMPPATRPETGPVVEARKRRTIQPATPVTKAPRRQAPKPTSRRVERTYRDIENTLKRLPQLRDRVTIVTDPTDARFPSRYQKEAKGTKAVFIENTGQIYLFAQNIKSKQEAVRVLLHEGVAHFGLRTIFNQQELTTFLRSVYETAAGGPEFRRLIMEDARYKNLNAIDQAEEYVAILAERTRIGYTLEQSERRIWNRVKNMLKRVLKKLGLVRITDKDIQDVISASIFNLAKKDHPSLYKKEYTLPSDINKVRASSLGKAFMQNVASGTPKLVEKIKSDVMSTFNTYVEKDNTGRKHTRRETTLDKFVSGIQDSMRRMKVVQRSLQELGGKITEFTNVYKIEEVSHNKTNVELDKFYKKFIEGKDGLVAMISKSAKEDVSAKQAFEDVSRLAYALHAIERNARIAERTNGEITDGSGMSTEEAIKIKDELGTPARMQAVDKLNEINNYRLELLEENNLLPKDVVKTWRETYNYYVPLKGWEELTEQLLPSYMRSSAGLDVGKKPFSEFAKGRTSIAADPLVHSIKQVEDVIKMKNRNEVARSLLGLVEDNRQFDDLWVLDKDVDNSFYKTFNKKTGKIELQKRASKFTNREREQVVTVINEQGLRQEILIKDVALARALKSADMQQTGPFIKMMGKVMRGASKMYTTYNPEFWLTNVTRDLASAIINIGEVNASSGKYTLPEGTSKKMISDFYKSFKAARASITGQGKVDAEWKKAFEKFRDYGGYTELASVQSFETLSKNLVKDIKRMRGETLGSTMPGMQLKRAMEFMDSTSSALENATRLNAFKQISDAYIAQGMDADSAYKRAASAALNLTVNFTRKGNWSAGFGSWFLFFNAAMQSNARLLRTLFKNWDTGYGKKVLAAMTLGSFMHGAIMRMIGGDDEDGIAYYDKIPQWERDNNFIIMAPGGQYTKIPLPYGFNILHVAGQAMSDIAARAKDGRADMKDVGNGIVRVFNSMFDNFVPMGSAEEGFTMFMPSLLRPAIQIETNRNWTGKPIYPETRSFHKGELPDSQKYWSSVSEMSKVVTGWLNKVTGGTKVTPGMIDISPETLDHLIGAYMGGVGKLSTSIFDLVKKVATTGDLELVERRDVPGFRKLFGDAETYQSTAAVFYKYQDKINVAKMALEAAKLEGTEAIRAARKKYRTELRLAHSLDNANKSLRKQGKQLRKARERYSIEGMKDFPWFFRTKEKINEQRARTMKRFTKRAEKVGL